MSGEGEGAGVGVALVPPHTMQGEESVLGAMLMDNACVEVVQELLQPSHFYVANNAKIYRAICELVAQGKPADVFAVFDRISGELPYLNELAQCVTSAANAVVYAQAVRERANRRELLRIGRDLADRAARGTAQEAPVEDLIDKAVTLLQALQQTGMDTEPQELSVHVGLMLDDLNARAEGKVSTFATGLRDLDRLTAGGGRRGELWVFGARPSMGKSALVLHLCRQLGLASRVLVCSMEDSAMMAATRFVAAAGEVNLALLRNPQGAPEAMWSGVADAVDSLMPLQISLDDQPALNMAQIRRKVQQVRRRHGRVDVLVVDYLQLMDDGGENRNLSLGRVAYGLQALAKELGLWVILLSQLSRKADERAGVPQMGDLRDSGDVEGAAHVIGLLHREYMRKEAEETKCWAQLHVAKQKNGPTGTLNLRFDGALQRFSDWDGPVPFRARGAG